MAGTKRTVTVIEAQIDPSGHKINAIPKQLRVAAYCRVSTKEEEQKNSYDVQVKYYTELIMSNPMWQFAGIYADEGITGTNRKKRTDFNRLMKDCDAGKIDLIICKSVARFARNTVDSLKTVRELKAKNIGVYFENQNLNTLTMDTEMMLGLHSILSQAESENISENIKWGIHKRFANGTVPFKRILGYTQDKNTGKEYIIIPEEAKTVQFIYKLYLDGCSINQIKIELIEKKMKTKTGTTNWACGVIQYILTNEKYVGDILSQKTYIADVLNHTIKVNNGELPKYYIRDHHPTIIDRRTFDKVQIEMKRRASKSKITTLHSKSEQGKYSKYALTELLVCGECGTHYRRCTWNIRGNKKIVWRCISRLENGKRFCKESPTLSEENIHKAILESINEFASDKSILEESLSNTVLESYQEEFDTSEVTYAKEKIRKLRQELSVLLESSTQLVEKELDSKFKKISNEITEYQNIINNAEEKADFSKIENENLQEILSIIQNDTFEVKEFNNKTVRQLISCIWVRGNNSIQIYFKNGENITKIICK